MEENKEELQNDSEEEKTEEPEQAPAAEPKRAGAGTIPSFWIWIGVLILAVAFSVMLTYTLTAAMMRDREIQSLQTNTVELPDEDTARDVRNMENLIRIIKEHSYYTDSMGEISSEDLLEATVRAYISESGDVYAVYYTDEEIKELTKEISGKHAGIGVTVIRDTIDLGSGIDEQDIDVYQIEEVYPGSGAEHAGLAVGEWIYAVYQEDGSCQTIGQLLQSGSNAPVKAIRGEAGTQVKLKVLSLNAEGTGYDFRDVTVMRSAIVTRSVRLSFAESDPTVAVVRISEFDYTTPTQFEEAIEQAKAAGALHFVFDVRGNLGGELASLYAVLANFLRKDDLVIAMVYADGTRKEHRVAPITYTDEKAGCSVREEQIGQYRDLDFLILCDERTASAAEAFTAALRDFGLTKEIVGQRTYGKGIVQNYCRLDLEGVSGYLKLTVAGYVTECGESYHGTGIAPTISAALPKEIRGTSTIFLAWESDTQLQTAVAYFSEINQLS